MIPESNIEVWELRERNDTLRYELERLREGIRAHRDTKGDNRCWRDDETLYDLLPERFTPTANDTYIELANCIRYIESRQNPNTVYKSPQDEIDRLNTEVKRLENIINGRTSQV